MARARGIATEVTLSRGPFRYVCLWICWKYFCLSISFSLGKNGASRSAILKRALKINSSVKIRMSEKADNFLNISSTTFHCLSLRPPCYTLAQLVAEPRFHAQLSSHNRRHTVCDFAQSSMPSTSLTRTQPLA